MTTIGGIIPIPVTALPPLFSELGSLLGRVYSHGPSAFDISPGLAENRHVPNGVGQPWEVRRSGMGCPSCDRENPGNAHPVGDPGALDARLHHASSRHLLS
jgi:hypothetical protein